MKKLFNIFNNIIENISNYVYNKKSIFKDDSKIDNIKEKKIIKKIQKILRVIQNIKKNIIQNGIKKIYMLILINIMMKC